MTADAPATGNTATPPSHSRTTRTSCATASDTHFSSTCRSLTTRAGAPQYAQKLIKIIEDYRLYRFDQEIYAKAEKKPDLLPPSPSQLQQVMELNPAKNSLLYKYSRNRVIYKRNGVPYILAGDLDTYKSIADEYNLFTGELLRFNDLKKPVELAPGTVVYLQRKKAKAQRHMEIHIAVEGDTYYDISQKYAVRLKKLFKYNGYKDGDILHVGDEIFLRRHR